MPINKSVDQQQTCDINHKASSLNPLTSIQCTSNFLPQLSENENQKNWLSLFPITTKLVSHFIQLPQPLLVFNARYWHSAVSVITEIFKDNSPLLILQSYDQQTLFGRLNLLNEQIVDFHQGEIYNFKNGCVVLHISPLLINPELWFLLKAFLINQQLPISSAVNGDKFKGKYPLQPFKQVNTKIILVSNRYQLDELSQIDPEYDQVGSLLTELASEIETTDENIHALQRYCEILIKKLTLPALSNDALALLFSHLAYLCNHQQRILFAPKIIENLIRYAQLYSKEHTKISAEHLQKALDIQQQSQSLAQLFSERSLLEKQLKIQLQGAEIGQINGMSVIELFGNPIEFGEIFRISATDMNGDGEIIDVERKVELAGNIHAKSMLIVQGYVNHFFTHIAHFPLSCNVVFEQSYQESDGDSAALAILLAVISCYSRSPLSQNLFVTGALDQHGNVLAIGGINQKIDAITRLFDIGLLTEAVTILIPKANQLNLMLPQETLMLINAKKINIYAIEHCKEAFPFAMNLTFNKVIQLINQRIEFMHKDESEGSNFNIFSRVFTLFK